MSNSTSNLPIETVIHILASAARSSRSTAQIVARVSHSFRALVLPILWSVVTVNMPPDPLHPNRPLPNGSLHFYAIEERQGQQATNTSLKRGVPLSSFTLSPEIQQSIRSLFVCSWGVASVYLHAEVHERVLEEGSALIMRVMHQLRRLSLPSMILRQLAKCIEQNANKSVDSLPREPKDRKLASVLVTRSSVTELYISSHILHWDALETLQSVLYQHLTHVHVRYMHVLQCRSQVWSKRPIDAVFPSVSHFAFECPPDFLPGEYLPKNMEHLDHMFKWILPHAQLKMLLILARDDATSDAVAEVLDHIDDRRVRSARICPNAMDDWIAWEQLAQDNNNSWSIV